MYVQDQAARFLQFDRDLHSPHKVLCGIRLREKSGKNGGEKRYNEKCGFLREKMNE